MSKASSDIKHKIFSLTQLAAVLCSVIAAAKVQVGHKRVLHRLKLNAQACWLVFHNACRKLQPCLQAAVTMLMEHVIDFLPAVMSPTSSICFVWFVCCPLRVQYDKIRGVTVMSPAVRDMQKTPVNDDICK